MFPDVSEERTVPIFRVMSLWTDPQPWRWRRDLSYKLQEHITEQHGATTQKNCFPYSHAVEASNHCFRTVKNRFPSDYSIFLMHYCVLLTPYWFSMKEWNNTSYGNNGTQQLQCRESKKYSFTKLLRICSIISQCLSQKLKKENFLSNELWEIWCIRWGLN